MGKGGSGALNQDSTGGRAGGGGGVRISQGARPAGPLCLGESRGALLCPQLPPRPGSVSPGPCRAQGTGQAQRSILTPAWGEEMAPGDAASSHQLSKAAQPGKEREDKEGGLGPREQGKAARGLT